LSAFRRPGGMAAALVVVTVSVLVADAAFANERLAGAKLQCALVGRPVQERSMEPLKPELVMAVTLVVAVLPAETVRAPGLTAMPKSATLICVATEALGLKSASPE